MDLKELFGGETIIRIKFGDYTTLHYFRNPTAEEDLEYRRRSASVRLRGRRIETSDQALLAPIWLYEKICQKVEVQNGTEIATVEDRTVILEAVKMAAIDGFLARIQREEEEELKNS